MDLKMEVKDEDNELAGAYAFDMEMNVDEHPLDIDKGIDSRKTMSTLMGLHQTIKQEVELETSGDYYDHFMNVKVEHPSEVELKHEVEPLPYQCSHCDSCFDFKGHLVQHLRSHTGEKLYSCIAKTFTGEECGKEFTKTSELRRHQMTHTKQYPNQCPDCYYSCKDKKQLESHIKAKHTIQEKTVTCDKCDYVCCTQIDLKRHSVIHTDKRFFSCEYCDYVCRKKVTLQEHQVKEHNDVCFEPESAAKCSKCDYVAVDVRELKRHSVIHTDGRFFTCEHCGYVCRNNKSLNKHMKTQHKFSNIKKCTNCEYVALTTRELTRHSVIHTGRRVFTCELCEYVCRNNKTLKKHKLKEHNTMCIIPE